MSLFTLPTRAFLTSFEGVKEFFSTSAEISSMNHCVLLKIAGMS